MKARERLKHIPIWPSLVTLASTFCGFLAMLQAYEATRDPSTAWRFGVAGALLLAAMVFDALDGRVARLTNQTTPFGAELDSLSDALSFGVAPAVLAWCMTRVSNPWLADLPVLWTGLPVAAASFAVCAILRLARFNVENEPDEFAHRYFKGLPSPAAAGVVAGLAILHWHLVGMNINWVGEYAVLPATFVAGILMVTEIRYVHAVGMLFQGHVPFSYLVLCLLVLVAAAFVPFYAPAIVFVGYAASGLVGYAVDLAAERIAVHRQEDSYY